MPPRRKVSRRQMEILLEFAESHREISLGRFPGGPQGIRVIRDGWDSVAVTLNSVAEGRTKTPDQWRRYWIEYKAKTKAKAADSRRNASATGGVPNKLIPLSDMEERVLALTGPVSLEGLPGVRIPIDVQKLPAAETASGINQSPAPEPQFDVEWLEEEELQPQPQALVPPPSAETQPADIPPHLEEQPEASSKEDWQGQRSASPDRRQRQRPQRQVRRYERAPRRAYDIEMRRIVAEERHATAMEAMVDLIRQIRDEIHTYLHHSG